MSSKPRKQAEVELLIAQCIRRGRSEDRVCALPEAEKGDRNRGAANWNPDTACGAPLA